MNDTLDQTKRDYGWVISILAAMLSAPAVISLIQHGFHVRLNWGFQHFVEFYRAFITPIIDLIQWPVRWLIAFLRLHFSIPPWLKDVHTLSFVLAGLYVRAWTGAKSLPHVMYVNPNQWRNALRTSEFDRLRHQELRALLRRFGVNPESLTIRTLPLLRALWLMRRALWVIVLGYFCISFFAWANALARAASNWNGIDYRDERQTISVRSRFTSLLAASAATSVAVVVFYLTNAVLPQLGL